MAVGADDEALPAFLGHELVPDGLRSPRPCEVGELADVVCIHLSVRSLAQLAPSGLEPSDQLFPPDRDRAGHAVDQDRVPFFFRRKGMPPNRATSGLRPSRSTLTSKHLRGPDGVAMVVL
jgi:hypothetical protein